MGCRFNILFMRIFKNTRPRQIRCRAMPGAVAPRVFILVALLVSSILLLGCVSFRFVRGVEGREVVPPGNELQVGKTTLGEVLLLLGAPDKLAELEGKDLLLYERLVLQENGLSLGIPVANIWGASIDISAYGTLIRYDTLAFFFTPEGVLQDMVFEKSSNRPYLRTLFTEK